jgi:hypothetical protein
VATKSRFQSRQDHLDKAARKAAQEIMAQEDQEIFKIWTPWRICAKTRSIILE